MISNKRRKKSWPWIFISPRTLRVCSVAIFPGSEPGPPPTSSWWTQRLEMYCSISKLMPRASSVPSGKYHRVGSASRRNARIDDTPLPISKKQAKKCRHKDLVRCSAVSASSCTGPVRYPSESIMKLVVIPDETPGLLALRPPSQKKHAKKITV